MIKKGDDHSDIQSLDNYLSSYLHMYLASYIHVHVHVTSTLPINLEYILHDIIVRVKNNNAATLHIQTHDCTMNIILYTVRVHTLFLRC